MNVPTITMPVAEAKAKLKAYRAEKHKDAEDVYRRTAEAYECLAAGTPIIKLGEAIRSGGFFDRSSGDGTDMPKLAIARADASEVKLTWWKESTRCEFLSQVRSTRLGTHVETRIDLERKHTWHLKENPKQSVDVERYTLVPSVPADVRPKTGLLRDWHVLFEVDQWYRRPKFMAAPADPLLLKYLGGELYAVLAEWELTDIERAVLETVRREQQS